MTTNPKGRPENRGLRLAMRALTPTQRCAVKILKALELHGATEWGSLRNSRVGHPDNRYMAGAMRAMLDGGFITARFNVRPDGKVHTVYERSAGLPNWLDPSLYHRCLYAHRAAKTPPLTNGGRWK